MTDDTDIEEHKHELYHSLTEEIENDLDYDYSIIYGVIEALYEKGHSIILHEMENQE